MNKYSQNNEDHSNEIQRKVSNKKIVFCVRTFLLEFLFRSLEEKKSDERGKCRSEHWIVQKRRHKQTMAGNSLRRVYMSGTCALRETAKDPRALALSSQRR